MRNLAGPSSLLAHHSPGISRFSNAPSVGPQVGGTEWLEDVRRDLRDVKLAGYKVTVDSFSTHVRDEGMHMSYVQCRTEIHKDKNNGCFPNAVIHKQTESRRVYIEHPGDRRLVDDLGVYDREGPSRENAGYSGTVHEAYPRRDNYSERVPAPVLSYPDQHQQKPVSEPPIRRPLEGQYSERQRVERRHTDNPKSSKQPSDVPRLKKQHTPRNHSESPRSSRKQSTSTQSSRQPRLEPPVTTKEVPDLDNWKNLLLALDALNTRMALEEVNVVGQISETAGFHKHPTSLYLPGYRPKSRQHSRQGRRSSGSRDGRSGNSSASFRCTVTSPYWEWDSVSTIRLQHFTTERVLKTSSNVRIKSIASDGSQSIVNKPCLSMSRD